MNRELYLKEKWNPYPTCPANSQSRGRIQKIARLSSTEYELTIKSDHQFKTYRFPACELLQILIAGDIVAVADEQITLLSPLLSEALSVNSTIERLQSWSHFTDLIQTYFQEKGFLSLVTPSLVQCPGTEPTLEPFETFQRSGTSKTKLFLPTSPELHLKKALHMGFEKIFEINRCYRNNEITDRHRPEFWMIEWYRAYENLDSIERDVIELVEFISQKQNGCRQPKKFVRKSVAQLFKETFDFDLSPETSFGDYLKLGEKHKIDTHSATSIDDIFFLLFFEVENLMDPEEMVFVHRYPPFQAALARIDSNGWAERFEVYWQGLELANAFHELNDPTLQRSRTQEDLKKRESYGKNPIGVDEAFFQALEAGLPPSAGIALGLERLFMAFHNISDIHKIHLF